MRQHLLDYVSLTKPLIVALLLLTTLSAMFVAAGAVPPLPLMGWTMLGGALSAGGASALNQYFDRELDAKMARTARRPIPAGRIQPSRALAFGLALSALSLVVFLLFVNLPAALLSLAGNLYYVLFYTLWLKRATPQNIVIGGAAGAIPPLVGWAAATGSVNVAALFLFAIIFYWTPPHFWALALLKRHEYARGQIPMLPVVWGEAETRRQIFLYSLIVVALTLLLTPARVTGLFYLGAAALLGLILLIHAGVLLRGGTNKQAWRMYKYSSYYLALLFLAMVVDRIAT
ncbi:MAG: protoheme IX farnesyltransferase [Chloroflexi bacterium]|nr:protoheme IX farnesyltransferase [Chloroflexota bacterium]